MSECYEHEKLRRQGSGCPYCYNERQKEKLDKLITSLNNTVILFREVYAEVVISDGPVWRAASRDIERIIESFEKNYDYS